MVLRRFALGAAVLPCLAVAGVGPTGTLYLTVAGGDYLGFLRGTDESYAATAVGAEGPIAVSGGTIRTTGAASGTYGASYTLAGDFAGNVYANPLGSASTDATTDAKRNYLVDGQGGVYATDLAYEAPTSLFSASTNARGIAYDGANGSLWVGEGDFLTDYSMAGAVLDQFALSLTGVSAVAFDPSDHTLWTGANFGGGAILSQYSTGGSLLQSVSLASGTSVVGMEFNAVPEPTSLAVLALGGLSLARRRRRSVQ